MAAYSAGQSAKHIAYVIINFDDSLHEYADACQAQIDQYVADNPVPGLEIVVFDIKPPFYGAMS